MNTNDIVEQIANGTAQLLSADEICKRLEISRSTFDRWVKNGSPLTIDSLKLPRPAKSIFNRGEAEDNNLTFPPPDIRIGNSPRWAMSTFKKWLTDNITR